MTGDRYLVHRYTGHIYIMDTATHLAVRLGNGVRWFMSRSQAEYICNRLNGREGSR